METEVSSLVAGVDEAGRGPLAGPVVAAAVILDPNRPIVGLMDSKKLLPQKREILFEQIIQHSLAYGVAQAGVEEIDELNIFQASLLAMQRAIAQLPIKPDRVLVDGKVCPVLNYPVRAIVRGDATVPAISAASILAKITRDREMLKYEERYPGYGFACNKGYATSYHLNAIFQMGITPIHRKSFKPVRQGSLFPFD